MERIVKCVLTDNFMDLNVLEKIKTKISDVNTRLRS